MENPRTTVDQIALDLDGRRYGLLESPVEKFRQPIPGDFRELAAKLRHQSAILALEGRKELTKNEIVTAYAQDLELLESYTADLKGCVHQAIRASIVKPTDGSRRNITAAIEATWKQLEAETPPLGRVLFIELNATRAALPPAELLAELKEEFERAVERMLQRFTFWLHRLVEQELMGLIDWKDLDVCRYHYFRNKRTEVVEKDEPRHEHRFDDSKPWGEKNEERLTRERQVRTELFRERHVHHIVNAKPYALDEYDQPIPTWVTDLLAAIPERLRSFFKIVDGQITLEEMHRQLVSAETRVESDVLSVYKYSPAMILGPFVFAGWSGDDLPPKKQPSRLKEILTRVVSP